VTVSEASKKALVERLGQDPAKISVVYQFAHSAHEGVRPEDVEAAAARVGVASPYALFVGRLEPRKNIFRILRAFASALAETGAQASLVLAGACSSRAYGRQVRRLGASLGLDGRLHLPGFLPEPELEALYAGARLFLFPSLLEGFGAPVLEAMRAGVPTVTSSTTATSEVAGDGALLVDPEDVTSIARGIAEILADEGAAGRWSERGRRRAAQFTAEGMRAQALAAFEGALERHREGRGHEDSR
jgi:glycosyltransferase involved in cell wall biosynthesis